MKSLGVRYLFDGKNWQEGVRLYFENGLVQKIVADQSNPEAWLVTPGFVNCHSHGFQRAMAAKAEIGSAGDNFWSWRSRMYTLVAQMNPDLLLDLQTMVFVAMLEAGYTSAAEFHYLHKDARGNAYQDPLAMNLAVIEAASKSRIRLLHLPVLYQRGGFDKPIQDLQKPFFQTVDEFADMLEKLKKYRNQTIQTGLAIHSLRAVEQDVIRVLANLFPTDPMHIHLAEQEQEVADCLAFSGLRPGELLSSLMQISSRLTLVHGTHLNPQEQALLSEANLCLCPITEANLGDGIFDLPSWIALKGNICIGSDSNIMLAPLEELRLLEYAQRLRFKKRNIINTGENESCAEALLQKTWSGGAFSFGQKLGYLAPGCQADWIEWDYPAEKPDLNVLLFASNRKMLKNVGVAGFEVVRDGRHCQRDSLIKNHSYAHLD